MTYTKNRRLGDRIWSMAERTSAEINASEVVSSIRLLTLTPERYRGVIAAVYPVVVGFNRALIRSLSNIDNVVDSWLVKGMADQLKEEQIHNDMWRVMLDEFEIDHVAIWRDFIQYLAKFTQEELDQATSQTCDSLSRSSPNFQREAFVDALFPSPTLALFHHMCSVASSKHLGFWAHFASQSAIENTIFGFVTESVYPAMVAGSPLNRGARSTAWWKEHAKLRDGADGRPSTEERHLHVAKANLNRLDMEMYNMDEILEVAEKSLMLFSAAIRWHDIDKGGQWNTEKYAVL